MTNETIVPFDFSTVSPNGRTKIIAIVGETFSFTRIDYFISKWKTCSDGFKLNTYRGMSFSQNCEKVVPWWQLQLYELVCDGLIASYCRGCVHLDASKHFKRYESYHSHTGWENQRLPFWCRYITVSQNWVIVFKDETYNWILHQGVHSGCSF